MRKNEVKTLQIWEKEFRSDAKADNYLVFRDYLSRLGLPDKPKLMLEGTIQMVRACCAYNSLDKNNLFDNGLLIAESNFEPRSLLAYRVDDPYYWYGREKTLKYLGVINFRHAC